MAFATQNTQIASLGGNLKILTCTYSAAVGDAAGTITIGAGVVYNVCVSQNTASGAYPAAVQWSYSAPTGTNMTGTLTIYHNPGQAIASGGGAISVLYR